MFERAFSLILRLLALWLLLSAAFAQAEGSRELTAFGGSRARTEWKDGQLSVGTNLVRRTLIHAYAASGEVIDLGSSAKGIGQGNINWIAPDGSTGNASTACTLSTTGRITGRAQEALGPATLFAGGYTPCTVTVGAAQSGIWTFEFTSPNPTSTANIGAVLATAAWAEDPTAAYVTAWDVTVRQAATERLGRVYTNIFSGNVMDAGSTFSAQFFVQTADGFRYRVDPNAMQPFGFHFYANNKGIRDAAGNPLYQSGPVASVTAVQHPLAPDDSTNVTHKLFLNAPDSAMPATAVGSFPTNYTSTAAWTYAQRSTWLYSNPLSFSVSGYRFVGLEGTENTAGTAPMGGFFEFTATETGTYNLWLDVNNDNVFGNGNDRLLTGNVVIGLNRIYWNGLDGNGTAVPASLTNVGIRTTLALGNGEIHFPYVDVEANTGGITVTRLNGAGAPSTTIFWNDTPLGGTQAIGGASSASGTHTWSGNFGDNRLIDTWSLTQPGASIFNSNVLLREADLRIVSKLPATQGLQQGQTIAWTVTVHNIGPSTATNAVFVDEFPGEVTGISQLSCAVSGAGACGAASSSGNRYTQTLTLAPLATATLVFQGTASGSATQTVTLSGLLNTAGVQRPADYKDPDAYTGPASATPTSTQTAPVNTIAGIRSQCTNSGQTSCNNIKTAGFSITTTVALAITKTNGVSTLNAGSTTSYTVTVANTGLGSLANATLTDVATPGLQCTAVSCTMASGTATCPSPGASPGQLNATNLLGTGVTVPLIQPASSLVFVVQCNVAATGL